MTQTTTIQSLRAAAARCVISLPLMLGCASAPTEPPAVKAAGAVVSVTSAPGTVRPPFAFTAEDEAFLDDVQRGAFNFLWAAGDKTTGLAPDRASKPALCSIAGVGFQLSALPIGVERGWITREEGRARAELILRSLMLHPEIRKAGFFQHFLYSPTATVHPEGPEHVVSTIDSALLFCGILTAGQYFGGEVRERGDAIFAAADFRFFVGTKEREEWKRGFVSLGWKPDQLSDPAGKGKILPYYWLDSGCEHRLVTFLGVCAPEEANRLPPELYYRLRRTMGTYADVGPMVWFPYSGALFVNQFSHCWINYAALGPDDPSAFGFGPERRPSVDWWENARRTVNLHRAKALENPKNLPTFGAHAWGLSASDCAKGYCVPGLFPMSLPMPGAKPKIDFATETPPDDYGDGTIAPYAAGTSIMFEPAASVSAMRYYRSLKGTDGAPLLWTDPAAGGFGFADAFNLGTGWVAADYVSIDQGPLVLAIENARTGLIWKIFGEHPWVVAGEQRLKFPKP